jgi:hypothetical protein
MKTTGLYIASVTSKGNGQYRLNDCWVESNYTEIVIGDIVTDKNNNSFTIIDYEGSPQLAHENLWLDVQWDDYPETDVAPEDNTDTSDYDSQIGSLNPNEFTPEISYRCRIGSSANSYPAYHYAVVLTDANMDDPGAQQGAVGDYLMDSTGQIFEVVEYNGWEEVMRVRDIEERPHASDGSSRPVAYEYAQFYRPTVGASVLPQGDISVLGDDAQDDAISFSNTEIWKHRGVSLSKDTISIDNITKITIGDGLKITENELDGWGGGKNIELDTEIVIEGSFTDSERITFTATEGQTIFHINYESNFIDVYMNGFKLVINNDFYANNGTSIVLSEGASYGDIIECVSYDTFSIANHYTIDQTDTYFVSTIGDSTIDGELTANAFNLASARIYKENIVPFTNNGLDLINTIDVMAFNYKADPYKLQRIGFIADDTNSVFAGPNNDYFDIGNTVGILLKAVQEMSDKIVELEDKLNVK